MRSCRISKAQNERLLYYGDIAPCFGSYMGETADRGEIGRMLDAINRIGPILVPKWYGLEMVSLH